MTNIDLQNLSFFDSIEREIFRKNGAIKLSDFPKVPVFNYSGFERFNFKLSQENGGEASLDERDEKLEKIINLINKTKNISKKKSKCSRICLIESLRNAQKHGNQLDEKKLLGVGYKSYDECFQIFVEDSGKIGIDPELFTYRNYVKGELKNNESLIDNFYEFTRKEYKQGNGGIGTRIIHEFSDDVLYSKSEFGGLLVKMTYNL